MRYNNLYLKIRDESDSLLVDLYCSMIDVYEGRRISPPISRFLLGAFTDGLNRIAQHPNSKDENWLKDQGELIYNKLFSEPWEGYLQRALSRCQDQGSGLRISIHTQGELAEETPWELLYDPQSNQFVSCTHDCVVVRSPCYENSTNLPPSCCAESIKQIEVEDLPVRILAVSASPPRYSSVHPDLELEALQERLHLLPSYAVNFSPEPRVPWEKFGTLLQTHKPHILHLVAHGNEQGIFFEDGRNIDYGTFLRQLRAIQSLRIIILSGCNSKYLLRCKSLLNTQPSILSKKNIWALLVTGTVISSAASLSFVKFLYTSLATHNSLTYAVGCARNSLAGSNTPESLQWSIPMLHDICDVIVFPPIGELSRLAGVSPFRLEEMFELRQNADEAASKVSKFQEWLHCEPSPSPDFFGMMNKQPKQIEPELIHRIVHRLSSIHDYPNNLTIWMNSTRNLASSTYAVFEQLDSRIDNLAKSKKSRIHDRELQMIKKVSVEANERLGELKQQFEQLLRYS